MTDLTERTKLKDLVDLYRRKAEEHAKATDEGNHRAANKAADKLIAIFRELRSRGPEAQAALLPLLEDDAAGIRLWAASHALEFAPTKGEIILEEISSGPPGFTRITASTALREWREGRLKFP